MKKISLLSSLLLFSCSSLDFSPKMELYPLEGMEGLSGLAHEASSNEEELIFWSHTDRGPNAEETFYQGRKVRPFIRPDFKPYLIKFSVNLKSKEVKVLDKISLSVGGLPNISLDEEPVDAFGKPLKRDIEGIDPESICFDGDTIWMGEEYRPSILKFNREGKLLRRYVPQGSFTKKEISKTIVQSLPGKLKQRKLNRGFEGIACSEGKVYAILQSPLPPEENVVLMVEFDTKKEQVTHEFIYPLTSGADKIGDLAVKGKNFYIIEQNSRIGSDSIHHVYRFNLAHLDQKGQLKKELVLDLVKAGFDFADKIEGLTVLDNGQLVIVNDNDFALSGKWDAMTGKAEVDSERKTFLGISKK